jgi:ABC-type oligopeptide transport system ATPase subunit
VVAIGSDHVVFASQRRFHANTNCLLSVVPKKKKKKNEKKKKIFFSRYSQVKKASNETLLVELVARHFNAANELHLTVQMQHFLGSGFNRGSRTLL